MMITAVAAGCATQPKLAPGTFFVDRTFYLKQDATDHNATFNFDRVWRSIVAIQPTHKAATIGRDPPVATGGGFMK
jgi:hypothetical protein